MQCMLNLESSPAQVLWWFIIFANSYSPLEGFINKFCHKFANLDGLERR